MSADQNARFLVFLKKLGKSAGAYRMMHVHVSQVAQAKKTRDNLSRAIATLTSLRNKYKDGEIFLLKNADLIFVTQLVTKPLLANAGDEIQKTFLGTVPVDFTNCHGTQSFYSLFEFARDFETVLRWAENLAGVSEDERNGGEKAVRGAAEITDMVKIKSAIHKVDMGSVILSQPIYEIGPDGKLKVAFTEKYVSVQALQSVFCPGVSLTARRWLFADLTLDLDLAVLRSLMSSPDLAAKRRLSINVNMQSLASEGFVKFDEELPSEHRAALILEINCFDFFDSTRLFKELSPFLKSRGYKLLLDAVNIHSIQHIDFAGMEFDLVKLFWGNELTKAPEPLVEAARAKIAQAPGNMTFVLSRCDNAESIRFARRFGIQRLQGRLVDQMVKKQIPL